MLPKTRGVAPGYHMTPRWGWSNRRARWRQMNFRKNAGAGTNGTAALVAEVSRIRLTKIGLLRNDGEQCPP
jgi:hypothetical protein